MVDVPKLCEQDASELAALTRSGNVSCREVVEAHLARIDAVNGALGAVTITLRDAALALAAARDASTERGPLHGVPFTVKASLDCLGSATTWGVPALRDALPYADAPAVSRLKAAGAIPIARTNLSEMGLRLCTVNPLHGRTLNPHDRKLTVGGSSGGDAAAVATGMAPLGLGSDMGGSLRVPAECCGVATLKPTTGRVPHAASLEPRDHGMAGQLMLAVGPLARSVRDLRLVLGVLAGRDVRDPRSVDAPLLGPLPDPPSAALVTALPGAPLPKATLRAIEHAGALLEARGWHVDVASPPELARTSEVFHKVLATDLSALAPQLAPFVSDGLTAHLERLCRSAALHESSNHRIHSERSRLARAWSAFFSRYCVVIGPNWGRPVWPIDADLDPSSGVALLEETVRFLTPGNVLGLPALTLPMGFAAGLPVAIQVYADLWREDLCLAAAEIIEAGRAPCSPIDPALAP